jgi:hypothetical protein
MTEAEWLACQGSRKMLNFLGEEASERKLRLFAVACYRCSLRGVRRARPVDEELERVLHTAERMADGEYVPRKKDDNWRQLGPNAFGLAFATAGNLANSSRREVSSKEQAALLRDIFGNPFRPFAVDPAWLTPTVTALAREMYESRDFSPTPILADALQDAGCEDADVLDHCRSDGPHVRGCWVVDLVLGKS